MNLVLRHFYKNAGKHSKKMLRDMSQMYEIPADLDEVFDIEYKNEKGYKLAADMFRPKYRGSSKLPVAIFIHGGGLFAGSRKMNRLFCEIMARLGHIVYSVEYRLIDEANGLEEISDICTAFDFVKQNTEDHGGDPEKVVVVAESAGAYLAIYAAALTKSRMLSEKTGISGSNLDIKGIILSSGMIYANRKDPIGAVYKKDLFGEGRKDKELMRLMNPEAPEVMESLPPFLLISSSGDFLKDYTLRYASKLKKAGRQVKLIYYRESKHLFHAFATLTPLLPESNVVIAKMKKWENAVLRREKSEKR
jgi:acetyl esterase/lipase